MILHLPNQSIRLPKGLCDRATLREGHQMECCYYFDADRGIQSRLVYLDNHEALGTAGCRTPDRRCTG